ncbi:hypothetical protein [Thermococcus sp.]
MRLTVKSKYIRDSFAEALKSEGIQFEVRERPGHEEFIGYSITGTLEEIEAIIEKIDGVDRDALREGFRSFKESVLHLLEHLKEGEDVENLLKEGSWVGDILDQLYLAGVLDYDGKRLKLKEGADLKSLKFDFKFPFSIVNKPEEVEKYAKQFVFTDLLPEYEFEFLELDVERINKLGSIASRYFPEEVVLKVYFALVGRAILAQEVLRTLGDKRVEENEIIKNFVKAAPMTIPTPRGTLVINYSKEALENVLRLLKKYGYIEIKAGKIRKLRKDQSNELYL